MLKLIEYFNKNRISYNVWYQDNNDPVITVLDTWGEPILRGSVESMLNDFDA